MTRLNRRWITPIAAGAAVLSLAGTGTLFAATATHHATTVTAARRAATDTSKDTVKDTSKDTTTGTSADTAKDAVTSTSKDTTSDPASTLDH